MSDFYDEDSFVLDTGDNVFNHTTWGENLAGLAQVLDVPRIRFRLDNFIPAAGRASIRMTMWGRVVGTDCLIRVPMLLHTTFPTHGKLTGGHIFFSAMGTEIQRCMAAKAESAKEDI